MNWEETIEEIRRRPEYAELVYLSYLGPDLVDNARRFASSEEFAETLALLKYYAPEGHRLMDLGSGNGISAVAFASEGYEVVAVEPDSSKTVGAGAIRELASAFGLNNLEVVESYAESLPFETAAFDIVYARQAMHHAHDLKAFVAECVRILKPGGVLFTVRDHVVFDPEDKAWFLREHPLQKFYGGENAFSPGEYREAMSSAGLDVIRELRYFDSVINYYPELTSADMQDIEGHLFRKSQAILGRKLGPLGRAAVAHLVFRRHIGTDKAGFLDERKRAGRIYSYIAMKRPTHE